MVNQEVTPTINDDMLLALVTSIQGLTLALQGKGSIHKFFFADIPNSKLRREHSSARIGDASPDCTGSFHQQRLPDGSYHRRFPASYCCARQHCSSRRPCCSPDCLAWDPIGTTWTHPPTDDVWRTRCRVSHPSCSFQSGCSSNRSNGPSGYCQCT